MTHWNVPLSSGSNDPERDGRSVNRYRIPNFWTIVVRGMPDANKKYRVPTGIYGTGGTYCDTPPRPERNVPDSGLVHAIFNVEPAIVAGQSLGFPATRSAAPRKTPAKKRQQNPKIKNRHETRSSPESDFLN